MGFPTNVVRLLGRPSRDKRVFGRYALAEADIPKLAREVLSLRVAAYEQRLGELQRTMGVKGAPPRLSDDRILKALNRESRDTALGIIRTHNDDLRAFIKAQPSTLSQRDLASSVRTWEADRAEWKGKQIALNEGMLGRNRADADVMGKNKLTVRQRVSPKESSEAICAGFVSRGWMRPSDVHFSLPAHVGCIHGWEYDKRLEEAVKGKEQVWLGDWTKITETNKES